MSTTDSANFYTAFQTAKRDIEAGLGKPSATGQEAPAKLKALKAELAAHISTLPAYDQRSCTSQLQELEARVSATRKQDKPKSRFAFARAPPGTAGSAMSTPPPAGVKPSIPPPSPPSETSTFPSHSTSSESAPDTSLDTLTISDKKGSLIRLPAVPNGVSVSLADISGSVIDLRKARSSTAPSSRGTSGPSTPITAGSGLGITRATDTLSPQGEAAGQAAVTSLHAQNLKRCILIVDVEGSAILHGLEDCLVVLSSHQFRIHSSHRTAILLHTPSVPIIEHCDSLYFGSLPAHLGKTTGESKHDKVQDFDWVKGGPSPNWRALGTTASEMLFSRDDADAVALMEEDEVEDEVDRLIGSIAGLVPHGPA